MLLHIAINLITNVILHMKLHLFLIYNIFSSTPCPQTPSASLTLREERKLRVFENMVLRRIFGARRDEVTGGMEEIAIRGAK